MGIRSRKSKDRKYNAQLKRDERTNLWWSTEYYTENYRFSNTNPLKTGVDRRFPDHASADHLGKHISTNNKCWGTNEPNIHIATCTLKFAQDYPVPMKINFSFTLINRSDCNKPGEWAINHVYLIKVFDCAYFSMMFLLDLFWWCGMHAFLGFLVGSVLLIYSTIEGPMNAYSWMTTTL